MSSAMKFNRKVYVIPEEKYLSMLKNQKPREGGVGECDSIHQHTPPAQASMTRVETPSIQSDKADEVKGGRPPHQPKDDPPSPQIQHEASETTASKEGEPEIHHSPPPLQPSNVSGSGESGQEGKKKKKSGDKKKKKKKGKTLSAVGKVVKELNDPALKSNASELHSRLMLNTGPKNSDRPSALHP